MTALIQAESLTRFYDNNCAVRNLSVSLEKGQVLGLLGVNGAGKTTTLNMLTGNLAPSSGQIHIGGFDLLVQPRPAKMQIGFLPDIPPLYKELTVREFLNYCADLHAVAKARKRDSIDHALNRCHLVSVANKLIGQLSKGFRQRVGIAQAILHNPQVIILDEPTTGLDPVQIRSIRELIGELSEEHAILLSTHALTEVEETCSHVLIIDRGESIFYETLSDLKRHIGAAVLRIRTRSSLPIDLFKRLPGVVQIEEFDHNLYHVHHQQKENIAESLAEWIVSQNAGLLELTPETKTLEELFVQLTHGHGANT